VIAPQREVSFGKAVLNDLFDLFALRKEAPGDPGHLTPVTLEQLFEGRFVARAGSGHERIVCRFVG